MSNDLKNVFSDEKLDMGGKLKFKDIESKNKYLKALDSVFEEGKVVEVDGISEISTSMKSGDISYPLSVYTEPGHVIVGPSPEPVTLTVNTEHGKRDLLLKRYCINKGIVLETDDDAIIYMKFLVEAERTKTITFSFRFQPEKANTIADVIESINTALGAINYCFAPDDRGNLLRGANDLYRMIQLFHGTLSIYKKLSQLEEELHITFKPADVGNIDEIYQDINELFFLLVKKCAIRQNARLTKEAHTEITLASDVTNLKEGSGVALTFTDKIAYSICNQHIHVYTASLLSNAVVKSISTPNRGKTVVFYEEVDSKPIFVSYTGFKTEEEALAEQETIMKNKEKYENAPSLRILIEQDYQ